MDQSNGGKEGGKWSDSERIVMLLRTEFAKGLEVGWRGKGRVKDASRSLESRAPEKEEKRKKASQRNNGIQNIAGVTRHFPERRTWRQGELPVVVQIGACLGHLECQELCDV